MIVTRGQARRDSLHRDLAQLGLECLAPTASWRTAERVQIWIAAGDREGSIAMTRRSTPPASNAEPLPRRRPHSPQPVQPPASGAAPGCRPSAAASPLK